MKVADYVIDRLAKDGIKEIFVVYGAANGDLIDAFVRVKDTKYICTMHEQSAGFAAEGYAKISGKYGAAIATSGPGGMNFVTPIGNCYYDSIPCIFLTGQINSKFLRTDPEIRQVGFQETDIVGIVKPITKYATMITDKNDIRYELEKALHLMTSGRPGPVLIDIPLNIQKADIDPDELEGYDLIEKVYDENKIEKQIKRFLFDLSESERPAVIIGGGVRTSGAVKELYSLMDSWQVPFFPTWNALDLVCTDHRNYCGRIGTYGGPGRNFGIQNCDLLLAIGSRISGRITGGNIHSFARGAKKYVVDVDPSLLQRKLQQVPFDECIYCDAKTFMSILSLEFVKMNYSGVEGGRPKWLNTCKDWKDKYNPYKLITENQNKVHPYEFARTLSEICSSDDIIVSDCGGNIVVMNHVFETKTGQRYITNNGNSPMGFSMCGAIGAWFANKGKGNVICVIGDGGFQMNPQELQTIKNYGIKIKVFIMDNHSYGITKAFQKVNFEGRSEACEYPHYTVPDFIKVVESYGIKAVSIFENDINDMKKVIRNILDLDEPVVCDVDCGKFHQYYPKIAGWATPIEDMEPWLDRAEFKSNMIIDPLLGWGTKEYGIVERKKT